ncbi:hypothetical protein BV20DRAFT_975612 [Pilatotrama ljubarskyi]|nr:hypothetical protein BV20DRAFT_975612 [Pilatotrama ljubarskyi]
MMQIKQHGNSIASDSVPIFSARGPAPTPAGSRKRALPPEANDESSQTGRKRTRAGPSGASEPAAQKSYKQSADFWYPDGNVVVIVGDTGFKLYRARLAAYCDYFANLSSSGGNEGRSNQDDEDADVLGVDDSGPSSDHRPQIPRTPSYEIEDLSVVDFTRFLAALETPLKYSFESPDQSTAISLLRAARRLKCESVTKTAKHALLELWKDELPHKHAPLRPYNDAISAIDVARKFDIPEVLKRALYELLRSPAFWSALNGNRHLVDPLSESDLLNLHEARYVLQREWRALVLTPPFAKPEGSRCRSLRTTRPIKCLYTGGDGRVAFWRSHIVDLEEWEKGAVDPIRGVDALKDAVQGMKNTWCGRCLNERKEAWEAARVRWWVPLYRGIGPYTHFLKSATTGLRTSRTPLARGPSRALLGPICQKLLIHQFYLDLAHKQPARVVLSTIRIGLEQPWNCEDQLGASKQVRVSAGHTACGAPVADRPDWRQRERTYRGSTC